MRMKRLKRSMALAAVMAMLVGGTAMAAVNVNETVDLNNGPINMTIEGTVGKIEIDSWNLSVEIGDNENGNPTSAGEYAVAIGHNANAANSAVAIGSGSVGATAKDNSVAIGSSAKAMHNNSIAIGTGSSTAKDNSVSFGDANHTRELMQVSEGTTDTSAVNKKQMDTALAAKADKATTLAGYGITDAYTKTEVDSALAVKANAADVYTKTETDNALASKANAADVYTKTEVDTALTAKADTTAVNTLSTQVDTNTQAITTNAGNIAQAQQAITANTTAINANTQAIANNTNAIAGLNQSVTRLDGRLDKVGAGAAALAALHPLDYDAENKLSFAAGMGNYGGETAGAVGAFYRPNEDVMFSIGGTAGNGENMVNLGVSFAIGKGSSGVAALSKAELVDKVQQMESEMNELKALVAQLMEEKKG